MGGGSLELVDVLGTQVGEGITLPLGGLALQDLSGNSLKKAQKVIRDALARAPRQLQRLRGRTFYAVGGTWRAIAKLHQAERDYPLHVMHNYTIDPKDGLDFLELVEQADSKTLKDIDTINEARRPLLSYGALLLQEIIRMGEPREVAISALGVREGLLFDKLDSAARPSRSASRRRQRSQPLALALAPAWRGPVGVDGPVRRAPSACRRPETSAVIGVPRASSRMWAGGPIRTIAASRASTSLRTLPLSASTIPVELTSPSRCFSATRVCRLIA